MRLVISQIISVTFQQISKQQLLKFLNLKDSEEEFNTLIQTLGWELSEGDLVKIQSNQFNEVKQGNVDETIKVQQLSKLFSFIN
jgi:non-ribosomal peptide synthetase component E (peptide arylation enzyme)